MNKLLTIIIIVILFNSCSEGRWIKGNSKHFQERHDHKLKQIKPNV